MPQHAFLLSVLCELSAKSSLLVLLAKTMCKQNITNNAAFKDSHKCDVGRWEATVNYIKCPPPVILCMEENNHCYKNSAIMYPVIKSNQCLFHKIQEKYGRENKNHSYFTMQR